MAKSKKSETRIKRSSRARRARGTESEFKYVRIEGGLLTAELLSQIAKGDPEVPGTRSEDYNCAPGERVGEGASDAWAALQRRWSAFREQLANAPAEDSGTTIARKYWIFPLMRALGYGEPKVRKSPIVIEEKEYRLSHEVNCPVAVHFVGAKQDLDARTVVGKGTRVSPHSLMQEFLNRSSDYLWGFVTNGLKFRFLRDNASFASAAYLEFDLESIFDSDSYADFYLFYLVAHASRFARRSQAEEEGDVEENSEEEPGESAASEVDAEPWIEKWRTYAQQVGVRSLDGLWERVVKAIQVLGAGFLERREKPNVELKAELASGKTPALEYYRELLHLVYRTMFVMIAEDRELFFPPGANPEAREIYAKYYSTARLRKLARRNRGSRHCDLWEQLKLTLGLCATGEPKLGIPALDSRLFSKGSRLDDLRLSNSALLAALRYLSHTTQNNVLQPINFRNLGVEELGSVYESLLEMKPNCSVSGKFELNVVAGNERKTTGSYYTPPALVSSLLDTALEPTLKERLAGAATFQEQEERLLSLKICDPACGSGCFLIGAARRLGKRLAQIRTQDEEPSPSAIRKGIRDVVSRCLYGVDINPMAAELCKVSLWLESMEPGKSLLFLDHRIKCGNSLFGATRALIEEGIPDAAYDPLEGDDKGVCKYFKRKNSDEAKGQGYFLWEDSSTSEYRTWSLQVAKDMLEVETLSGDDPQGYAAKEARYASAMGSFARKSAKDVADLWCAAFVWKKTDQNLFCPTLGDLRRSQNEGDKWLDSSVKEKLRGYVDEYQFFHWELEFPTVFPEDGDGGFDVVLGNPPWEKVKLMEKEWFALREPQIANAPNKPTREKLIYALKVERPELLNLFKEDVRKAKVTSQFLRTSGRYPLCGRGDVNTYAVFAELIRESLISPKGRVGCIVPSGIATDNTTMFFFNNLLRNNTLLSLYDFDNNNELFPAVAKGQKFSLISLCGSKIVTDGKVEFSFCNSRVSDLNREEKRFRLTLDEINFISPNTGNSPVCHSIYDAILTKAIYRRIPIFVQEQSNRHEEKNFWEIHFPPTLHMTNDAHLFKNHTQLELEDFELIGDSYVHPNGQVYWRVYEGKMAFVYDHRAADVIGIKSRGNANPISYEEHMDRNRFANPRYWILKDDVLNRMNKDVSYYIGLRDITNAKNNRTCVPELLPITGIGNTINLLDSNRSDSEKLCLYSLLSSYVLDYVARQRVGGTHLNQFILKQLPILPPERFTPEIQSFVTPRVLELCYTATDLRGFAKSLGYEGEPFVWDEARRFLLRCELDALYFGLYFGFGEWSSATEAPETAEEFGELTRRFPTPLDALDYVMETFPIVKRKELADEGLRALARERLGERGLELGEDFPSKGVIRAMYREMSERGGVGGFGSWLDPGQGGEA